MTTLQTLPGEERHGAKDDRQPAGVGSASAGVGGRDSHMWRLPEQEAEGEILLFLREGMGSHLGLRCCCLTSWVGSYPQSALAQAPRRRCIEAFIHSRYGRKWGMRKGLKGTHRIHNR